MTELKTLIIALLMVPGLAWAADWPMYRADGQRSGYTSGALPAEMTLRWEYRAPHSPQPAWPRSPRPTTHRQTFDWSIQPVVAGGTVYFGDTVTGAVTALDLKDGSIRWQFITQGPIRLAPVVYDGWLLVASDDGCLYAIDRHDGQLAWQHRGGPEHSLRLGNERMISRWPARGGPVVSQDRLYYAAGIWPSEGVYLHCLDARSGQLIWTNDSAGQIYMPQPHGGADAESGVAAQGALVVSQLAAGGAEVRDGEQPTTTDWLLMPTGRAVPAAFDRELGQFRYFHLQKFGQKGGSYVAANGRCFINSGIVFDLKSGEAVLTIGEGPVALTDEWLVAFVDGKLAGFRWTTVDKTDRKGAVYQAVDAENEWSVEGVPKPTELIVAGSTVVVGAVNEVVVVDRQRHEIIWRAEVDGTVWGLAVSDGRLLVSTDQGVIHCFDSVEGPTVETSSKQASTSQFDGIWAERARLILAQSDLSQGYCLDLGCGDGALAEALAEHSQLQIIAIDSDWEQVQRVRQRLLDRELLGARVTVLHVPDLAETGLPNYFADLIVSQRGWEQGVESLPEAETWRLLRPFGGLALLGSDEDWQRRQRGALEGGGQWTHQYATAGNATCSTDELVKGPLGMLWFRDLDVAMPQRHGRGPGPLFFEGRLYSMGLHELVCLDAYNGRLLWRYALPNILKAYDGDELMGAAGTHSNYCVADSGVYVRREGHCLRIDRATGQLIAQFEAPTDQAGQPGIWGFIACEQGVLIGSLADADHVVTFRYVDRGGDMNSLLTESKTLFGMDAETGEVLWRYDAEHSIRHNAIALGQSAVYLIDRPQALEDRIKKAKVESHPPGSLVAVDARSGLELWRNEQNINGTLLAISQQHPLLLMGAQPTRFALESEQAGTLAVFDVKTGQERWRQAANYSSRPLINDRTIYSQGGAWDLLSGSPLTFDFKRSYGCGVLAGSKHLMVFRSATLGYFDFERQGKVENYGGVRPGCWINAIPAGGLVLVPDASAGCVCSYLNQAWFALEPDGPQRPLVEPAGGAFERPVEVALTADQPGWVVRFTLDGSPPNRQSPIYEGPLHVEDSLTLKARAYDSQGRGGRLVQAKFVIGAEGEGAAQR